MLYGRSQNAASARQSYADSRNLFFLCLQSFFLRSFNKESSCCFGGFLFGLLGNVGGFAVSRCLLRIFLVNGR